MFNEGFISLVGVRKVDNVILLKDLPPLTSLIPILEFCFKKSCLPHLVGLGFFFFKSLLTRVSSLRDYGDPGPLEDFKWYFEHHFKNIKNKIIELT